MGQMDRDYWRKRYNKRTGYSERSPLRVSYRELRKPFWLRFISVVWRFMTCWPVILCIWAFLAYVYFGERYLFIR